MATSLSYWENGNFWRPPQKKNQNNLWTHYPIICHSWLCRQEKPITQFCQKPSMGRRLRKQVKYNFLWLLIFSQTNVEQIRLPRWLSGLSHSAHRPERPAGEPGFNPRYAGRFRVRISGAHALRLISRASKEGSTVSAIVCDRWLILS